MFLLFVYFFVLGTTLLLFKIKIIDTKIIFFFAIVLALSQLDTRNTASIINYLIFFIFSSLFIGYKPNKYFFSNSFLIFGLKEEQLINIISDICKKNNFQTTETKPTNLIATKNNSNLHILLNTGILKNIYFEVHPSKRNSEERKEFVDLIYFRVNNMDVKFNKIGVYYIIVSSIALAFNFIIKSI